MLNGRAHEVVLGEHIYQPPRRASHHKLRDIATDPQGKNWTKIISNESYEPQAELGIFGSASFDMYGALRHELRSVSPETLRTVQETMQSNGVGDPYIHPILPDLSPLDKRIVITAGKSLFERDAKASPQWFWPPETALDDDTLEALIESGYKGVLCAPEQIVLESGRQPESQLVELRTKRNRKILAFPFDRPISSALAFQDKSDAESFAWNTVLPRLEWLGNNSPRLFWTDGETFGHHAKFADKFLAHLLFQSLPSAGVEVVPINALRATEYGQLAKGKLVERSAWSCPHGDLVRWHGGCACCWEDDTSWKHSFYHGFAQLNESVTELLDRHLGQHWAEELALNFPAALHNPGGRKSSDGLSLLSAKAASLTARTSCGTFYGGPHTSGRINTLFAEQSLQHLQDAGLKKEAQVLRSQLAWNLESMGEVGRDTMAGYFRQLSTR